jgi:hypothetical protein
VGGILFRPCPGLVTRGGVPIACAMGYFLAPLPGLDSRLTIDEGRSALRH